MPFPPLPSPRKHHRSRWCGATLTFPWALPSAATLRELKRRSRTATSRHCATTSSTSSTSRCPSSPLSPTTTSVLDRVCLVNTHSLSPFLLQRAFPSKPISRSSLTNLLASTRQIVAHCIEPQRQSAVRYGYTSLSDKVCVSLLQVILTNRFFLLPEPRRIQGTPRRT